MNLLLFIRRFFSLVCFLAASCAFAHIQPFETPVVNYLRGMELVEKKSGVRGLDCVYVINLDYRPDKWGRMRRMLKEYKIKANRFPGILGRALPSNVFRELAGPYPINISPGEVGCLLSHVSVLKDAYQRNFNRIWVLEDDAEIVGDLGEMMYRVQLLDAIDPLWDIFYTDKDSRDFLGNHISSVAYSPRPDQSLLPLEYYTERTAISDEIERVRIRYGTYSMIISQRGIKKILDYFTHVYLWNAIDIDMHYIPGIREYGSKQNIVTVYATDSPSDVRPR